MALGENLKASQAPSIGDNETTNSEELEHTHFEQDEDQEYEKLNSQLYCVFDVRGEEYAIPMGYVKEVVKMPHSTPIPQMPTYFSSMANIRGEIYGILDLSLFFQDEKQDHQHNYLLVLKDEEYRVAIALNHTPNTLKVNENMIEELSSSTFGSLEGKKYLTGIVKQGKQMIVLFDVKGMISSESFAEV